jgi:hypothetical protein
MEKHRFQSLFRRLLRVETYLLGYLFSPVVIEMSFKSKKLPRISRIPRML